MEGHVTVWFEHKPVIDSMLTKDEDVGGFEQLY